ARPGLDALQSREPRIRFVPAVLQRRGKRLDGRSHRFHVKLTPLGQSGGELAQGSGPLFPANIIRRRVRREQILELPGQHLAQIGQPHAFQQRPALAPAAR
ncbi:hypothetical protein RZS08_64135, partial [Arthrospira platensis SPKY1]|nr:hypothetical protein [Arthrospira platensis SPKY1]